MIPDASALLAYLRKEPGEETVLAEIMAGAQMSVVNFAEVATRHVLRSASDSLVRSLHVSLPLRLLPLDSDMALEAALMAGATATSALSLGDRCCLATAKSLGIPAMTADRAWAKAAPLVGVDVRLIR